MLQEPKPDFDFKESEPQLDDVYFIELKQDELILV